jgi:capsular polysaccharide biosynthesis protein
MAGTSDGGGTRPVAASLGKVEAVRDLAARAGLGDVDAEGMQAGDTVAAIARVLGRLNNPQVELRDGARIPGASIRLVFGKHVRALPEPLHVSGMPDCFTAASPTAHSPDFRVLELTDGYFCHYRDGPLVVSPSGDTVARDFSSRYAGLVHYYETPLRQVLADAMRIDGTVVVLADDVRPLNYCHWMVDWLPRLAFLGEQARRPDTFVVVPPLGADYPWETLAVAGFPRERVIQLGVMQGLRARRLLVPSDLAVIPHPGHKAAPWLTDYLRGTLGYGAFLNGIDGPPFRQKIYVSRGDAAGRRVLNEAELIAALAPLGYEPVTMAGMPVARQIAMFACASHIVAPHGAGLANIVFADRAATLVEIFPRTYGTAAYYVLAAGLGMTYASYISDAITPGSRAQLDDISVDIQDFLERCRGLL